MTSPSHRDTFDKNHPSEPTAERSGTDILGLLMGQWRREIERLNHENEILRSRLAAAHEQEA